MSNLLEYVEYDETSPSFLRWKVTVSPRACKGYTCGTLDDQSRYKFRLKGTAYRNSRVIWEIHNGEMPEGFVIDHINRDPTDNRINNLRLATRQENSRNMSKKGGTSSVYKGVSLHARSGRWRATIQVNDRQVSLGYHDTEESAAEAYSKAAQEHFGEYAGAYYTK